MIVPIAKLDNLKSLEFDIIYFDANITPEEGYEDDCIIFTKSFKLDRRLGYDVFLANVMRASIYLDKVSLRLCNFLNAHEGYALMSNVRNMKVEYMDREGVYDLSYDDFVNIVCDMRFGPLM